MLSTSSNDYDHIGRERHVIELYKQGRNTRDIAKELRMSLRDISILRDNQVSHGIVITDNSHDNTNNKSPDEKATKAYNLYDERKNSVDVAVQSSLSEKEATRYYKE
jgi:DNA-directed RNA polymerase specialized sigma subunit